MNDHLTYRKTAKGAEAIAARAHGLVGRSRSLLILVDGKRARGELLQLGAGFGDVSLLLAQLIGDGFIELLPASDQTLAVATSTVPAAALKSPATLADVKTFASRRLMETLGPTSEQLCLKIESAQNLADFVEAVKRAYVIVRDIRGGAEAERFGAAVEANLPTS